MREAAYLYIEAQATIPKAMWILGSFGSAAE